MAGVEPAADPLAARSRSGEVWRARLAAVLAAILAVLVGAVLLGHGPVRAGRATSAPCEELVTLTESLDLTTLSDQATIRSSATRFARSLADQTSLEAAAGDPAAAAHKRVLDEVRIVLATPRSTSSELAQAVKPVATQCQVSLAGFGA